MVVGSVMVDLVAYTRVLPAAGETVIGSRFASGCGGKGANQAVMAALLGTKVHFVGSVGSDSWGDEAISNLSQFGIDTTGLTRSDTHTGLAPIWVEQDSGENRIIVIPGANQSLTSEYVASQLNRLKYDAVVCQLEIPQEATIATFLHGRSRGAVTILNPAPWAELSDELLALADWIVPNEGEFAGLAQQLGVPHESLENATMGVSETLGVRLAVTVGDRGALLCLPGDAPVLVPAPMVDVCDTTGAGDAFVGAFAYGLSQGHEPVKAATLACDRAADSVTRLGTQASFRAAD